MKRFRRYGFAVMFALVLMVLGLTSTKLTAQAATPTLATNKDVTLENWCNYKITIKKDSYLEITAKSLHSNYTSGDFDIYDKTGKKYLGWTPYVTKGKTSYMYLPKGTYTLRNYGFKKVKVAVKTPSFPSNYCKKKAITLKKGKQVVVVQTPDQSYPRWYKINLTKSQVIRYTSNNNGSIYLYDKDLNHVNTVYTEEYRYTEKKLAKGTYYVVISGGYYSGLSNSRVTTFSWK